MYRSSREAGEPFAAVIMDLTITGGMGGKERSCAARYPGSGRRLQRILKDPILADLQIRFRGIITNTYKLGILKRCWAGVRLSR